MDSGYFLLGLLLVTFVWQIVAQSLGPVVGGWLYGLQVENQSELRELYCIAPSFSR